MKKLYLKITDYGTEWVTKVGEVSSAVPGFVYFVKSGFELHLVDSKNEPIKGLDSAEAYQFNLDAGTKYTTPDDTMAMTLNGEIDQSRLATEGVLTIPINTKNANFRTKIEGLSELAVRFELVTFKTIAGNLEPVNRYHARAVAVPAVAITNGPPEAIVDQYPTKTELTAARSADLATASADATTKSNTAKTEAVATAKTYTDAEVAKKPSFLSKWVRYRANTDLSTTDIQIVVDGQSPHGLSSTDPIAPPPLHPNIIDIYADNRPVYISKYDGSIYALAPDSVARMYISDVQDVSNKGLLGTAQIPWTNWDKTATYIPITTSKKLAHVVTGTQPAGIKTINVNITNMAPSAVLTVRVKGDAARIQYKNAASTTMLDKVVSNNDVVDFVKIGTELVPLLEVSNQVLNQTTTELDAQNLGIGSLAFDNDQYKLKVSFQESNNKPKGTWVGPGDLYGFGTATVTPLVLGMSYSLKGESFLGELAAELTSDTAKHVGICDEIGTGIGSNIVTQGLVKARISESVGIGEYAYVNTTAGPNQGTIRGEATIGPGCIGVIKGNSTFTAHPSYAQIFLIKF